MASSKITMWSEIAEVKGQQQFTVSANSSVVVNISYTIPTGYKAISAFLVVDSGDVLDANLNSFSESAGTSNAVCRITSHYNQELTRNVYLTIGIQKIS